MCIEVVLTYVHRCRLCHPLLLDESRERVSIDRIFFHVSSGAPNSYLEMGQ